MNFANNLYFSKIMNIHNFSSSCNIDIFDGIFSILLLEMSLLKYLYNDLYSYYYMNN